MKIIVKNKEFESGKITRNKYKIYTEVRDELVAKELYSDLDLEKMIEVIVKIFDNQFTIEDIDDDMEVSDIIFNFSCIEFEVANKVNKRVEKINKDFTKGKR